MAKAAVTEAEKRKAAIAGTITQYMHVRCMDEDKLAKALGIQKDTLRRKMKDPRKFWIREILDICQILRIPASVNLFIGALPENEDLAYRIVNIILGGAK